jgi:hypothetical protein
MYSSDRFMTFAENFLKKDIKKDAIEEVKERFEERLRVFLEKRAGNANKSLHIFAPNELDFLEEITPTEGSFKTLNPDQRPPEKADTSADKIDPS